MSNKTSDKEVASLEIVIKDCREHLKIYGEAFITASELDRIENILAELEQKDKQIKDKFIKMAKEVIDNSILKQVVIDKIDELKLSGGSDGKDNVENLVRELTIDILQELLEGERK